MARKKGEGLLGVIFTGGQGPKSQYIKQLIDAEAKNALFIAADSGLEAAESIGIKPDWLIGDMDSLDTQSRLAAYPPQKVIRLQHDKDFTDTEMAFSLAVEKGCEEIWIIGGGGGRIDHLFGIRSLFERRLFPKRWITDEADIYCIEAQKREWQVKHETVVSVFPLGNGPWQAESTGLKWPLAGLEWNRGFFGLSNVATENSFSVTAKQGRFMIVLLR